MVYIIISILFVILLSLIIGSLRIVKQAESYVVERFGGYRTTWGVGIHFKMPFIDRVAKVVSMKEHLIDFPPQDVITKDNVKIGIDSVIFYQITDPKLFAYGIAQPTAAIENLTATTLRNLIGQLELDETLTSRDHINVKMREILDEATDAWGIKVTRVEVKNINPPAEIQQAMEKQMRAERERRESILIAEGEKKSAILIAEGKKESAILNAEAEKQSAILKAEAEKEASIRIAEGEAQAILSVQQATADGIKMIREAKADDAYITLRSLSALEKLGEGQSTKIIIPSQIQGVAGLATTMKELLK